MIVDKLARTGDQWSFRRLPAALFALGIQPKHVIHVGANIGQEVPHFRAAGIERITLVEPDPETAGRLRAAYPDLPVLEVACGPEPGTAVLRRVAGQDDADHVWSTLHAGPMPHDLPVAGEVPVQVVRLADIQGDADMAIIDTQGTELEALAGADLGRLQLVVVETHDTGDPNAHAGNFPDVVAYMAGQGWVPVLQWQHERPTTYFATFADTFFAPAGR